MILDSSLLIVTLSIFAPSPCRLLRSTVSQASDSCWRDGMSSGLLHWVTHAKYSGFKIYSSSTVERIKLEDDDNINHDGYENISQYELLITWPTHPVRTSRCTSAAFTAVRYSVYSLTCICLYLGSPWKKSSIGTSCPYLSSLGYDIFPKARLHHINGETVTALSETP